MTKDNKDQNYSDLKNRILELEAKLSLSNKEQLKRNEYLSKQKDSITQFRAIYDHSSIGISIYNHDGIFVDGNNMVFEMFGVKPEELINKFDLKNDPNYQDTHVWKQLNRGIKVSSNIIFSFEKVTYESKMKGIRHYTVTTLPFKEYSSTIGYIVEVIDITDQRKMIINEITTLITNALSNNNSKLLEFISHIESSSETNPLWDDFSALAREVRNEFLTLVSTRFPTLSPNELKIITLLRLNLTSKQIAHTLARSIRTIENTRFNIRKKMGIESNASLSTFLKSIY